MVQADFDGSERVITTPQGLLQGRRDLPERIVGCRGGGTTPPSPVPLPGTLALGGLALLELRRRRQSIWILR